MAVLNFYTLKLFYKEENFHENKKDNNILLWVYIILINNIVFEISALYSGIMVCIGTVGKTKNPYIYLPARVSVLSVSLCVRAPSFPLLVICSFSSIVMRISINRYENRANPKHYINAFFD